MIDDRVRTVDIDDKRAAFLAALEYGVSPLVDAGYEHVADDGYTRRERHLPHPDPHRRIIRRRRVIRQRLEQR